MQTLHKLLKPVYILDQGGFESYTVFGQVYSKHFRKTIPLTPLTNVDILVGTPFKNTVSDPSLMQTVKKIANGQKVSKKVSKKY